MIRKVDVLMFNQILTSSIIQNIWKTVGRTCMLILGFKGLAQFSLISYRFVQFLPVLTAAYSTDIPRSKYPSTSLSVLNRT